MNNRLLTASLCLCVLVAFGHFGRLFADDGEAAVKDIHTVKVEDYKAARAVFAKRPKPKDMVFNQRKLQNYLNSLKDKSLKKAEYAKIKRIHKVKEYIIHLMARNPYPKGLYLNFRGHKRKVGGVVTMANENMLMLKKSKRSKRSKRYKWGDLDPVQYAEFLAYFAQMRMKMTEVGATAKERREQAANDYLTAAVFCDWFGLYDKALKYAKMAIKTMPEVKPEVEAFIIP